MKKFGIERLKALEATEFSGTIEPKAEKWLKTLEKCFRVMQCLEEGKVDLAVFYYKKRLKIGGF